jgi:glycerol-3-phosphate acyltransferase PlsY
MQLLWLVIIGYFVGSFPTGFILAKFCDGIDLRKFGSGSTGATNVLRSGNKKMALFTLIIDTFKGALTAGGMSFFVDLDSVYISSFFCVVGHIFPVWLLFRGGKGVATSAGVFLIFAPFQTVISILLWKLTGLVFKISSLSSFVFIGSCLIFAIYEYIRGRTDIHFIVFTLAISILIGCRHYSNIMRLIKGDEKPITPSL